MSISTISQLIRHFYFNYHHSKSSPLWMHSAFMRRVQYAVRQTICFLFASFLAYGTPLNKYLSIEFLIPIISLLCLQETVGSTVSYGYRIVLALTPLSILLFLTRKIGLGYHNYVASELLLLFTTVCIAYTCTQIQARKVSLLYNVVFFASNFSRPNTSSLFAFELLGVHFIAIIVALLISLIVFPHFATFDIENRFNYSLAKFQEMHTFIIQAFLSQDKTGADMSLARAGIVEGMIHKALTPIQTRIEEADFEATSFLQRIFNQSGQTIIHLTLKEREDVILSLLTHLCSLRLMVKHCLFNDYHCDFVHEVKPSLLHLITCQSTFISNVICPSSITRDEYALHLVNLNDAFKFVRSAYVEARLQKVKQMLSFAIASRSEDFLPHAFFFFQLDTIVRILTKALANNRQKNTPPKTSEKEEPVKFIERLKLKWPRVLSSIKCMIIIGVGSIFVLVPRLAVAFENGQWILITICMTQGDTVGGAFTTMKMRLIGTLLGAIWAYVTYLTVHDNVYQTIGMLSPWILIFGYLKLLPTWGYTAMVASFTPIIINLGRLPFGDALPAGNYALLRIEESFVGIAIGATLTLLIFPIFAIDTLKDNIQTTLQTCRQSIISMHSIYNDLFHHGHSRVSHVQVELERQEVKSFIISQRSRFHSVISLQRVLVQQASFEPTLWWIRNAFSSKRYNTLVQQQLDLFGVLHNIDASLLTINEYSQNIAYLQENAGGGNYLPNVNQELSNLIEQLSDCFHLWTSYFRLTQTRFHRLFRRCTYSRTTLLENNLKKHEQCLIELNRTIHRLQTQHQEGLERLVNHYLDRLSEGDSYAMFIPYLNSDEADSIFIAYYAMHYSTSQLARTALRLGETVHTIFELETTDMYRSF